MREIHGQFLELLYDLDIEMPFATGGIKGGSPVANLRPHVDNRYFYQLDLANAFSQVDIFSLAHSLSAAGLIDDVHDIESFLRAFCQPPGRTGLCTGAPTSPFLFNLGCQELDRQLGVIAKGFGFTYTRYFDDLTFSSLDSGSWQDIISRPKRRVIRDAIEQAGWVINNDKTLVHDLAEAPVIVTGLQLNRTGKWQLPTHYLAGMETELDEILEQVLAGNINPLLRNKLAGYKGLLIATWDNRREEPTLQEKKILEKYKQILYLRASQARLRPNSNFF